MGVTIGPADWWSRSAEGIRSLAISCPVGTTLPDGSRIICKAGGSAWIVAPCTTEVRPTWNGTTTLLVGNKPCVSDWATLNTQLINCGFNPCDWFVPCSALLTNPGYCCRSQWDSLCGFSCYWSSSESSATNACFANFGNGSMSTYGKGSTFVGVRAMRCVTY